MAEVVRRLLVGETLNTLSAPSTQWLRATEELFFRDPPLFSISGIVSEVRPGPAGQPAQRLLADVRRSSRPHPRPRSLAASGGTPTGSWKQDIGDGVNSGFREKWTELLRQVWLGIENASNGIGPNATDREYVAFLCQRTARHDDDAPARRPAGPRGVHATSRTMCWFHLTLESRQPDRRRPHAPRPPARRTGWRRSPQRVGMTPAPRARELFELAELMSALLRAIELGVFDTGDDGRDALPPNRRDQRAAAAGHEPDHRPVAVRHG